ncbi:nitrilase [bacterium DOLZORAL124_64_63]|nr:MAG: nitrilase [bacterium DOLZORAL124_64_63]
MNVRTGREAENRETAAAGIRELAARGAVLGVLPELWSSGFDYADLEGHARRFPDLVAFLSATAREHGICLAGSLPEYTEQGIHNTLVMVDADGEYLGGYRKIHLFTKTGEHLHFASGDAPVLLRTSLGLAGLMICYDLRFPELCRGLTIAGAKLVIVAAQWPAARKHHWDALLQARAIENQIFIIGVNRVGKDGDTLFSGHSAIISPNGEILSFSADRPEAASAVISFAGQQKLRDLIPCLRERRPHVYGRDADER